MEPGDLEKRRKQLGHRKDLLDALEALDALMESEESEQIIVDIIVDARVLGAVRSTKKITTTIIPDEETDLGDVANLALDGAKRVIKDMIYDVKDQYTELTGEEPTEDEPWDEEDE